MAEIVESYPSQQSKNRPELSAEPVDKRPIIFGVIAAVVIILVFGGLGVWLFFYPAAAAVLRDIFIIYLGLGTFVIILLLIALVVVATYLVLKINDLIQLLQREIQPLLVSVQNTAATVKGTTTFISDHAVQPVIATASTISGIKAIFRSLFKRN